MRKNNIPKHSSGGGFSESDIRFIKTYHKDKKSYNNTSITKSDNFDCKQRQAPFKTFLKVNRDDYSRVKHFTKIRNNLPKEQANRLILMVEGINDFTKAKMSS